MKMVGLKCDIDVMCVPIDDGVWGCTYVPEVAGKFILVLVAECESPVVTSRFNQ